MKRLLRCALLAAQLAACHHESAGQAQAKALLDRGVAAYQKADYAAGLMYWHGNGIAADAAQAFAQFQIAADKGDITSQYWLGYLYENGIGTAQDLAQARHWYEISAQRGDHIAAPAMTALGRLYEQGKGVTANRATAVAWYEKAAATGDSEAQTALARLKAGE